MIPADQREPHSNPQRAVTLKQSLVAEAAIKWASLQHHRQFPQVAVQSATDTGSLRSSVSSPPLKPFSPSICPSSSGGYSVSLRPSCRALSPSAASLMLQGLKGRIKPQLCTSPFTPAVWYERRGEERRGEERRGEERRGGYWTMEGHQSVCAESQKQN